MPTLSLDVRIEKLELAERFVIARESWDVAVNVFVEISYGEHRGIGEASPDLFWGESPESVEEQLRAVELGALDSPLDLERAQSLLPPGSARCAFDMALHDVCARHLGLPLHRFLGLPAPGPVPTSVTVPISSLERMVEKARELRDLPILKTKVGFDGDVDTIRRMREVYPGTLRVDANEGWDPDEAIERLRALEPFDIELCEQPIPSGDLDALGRVAAATEIPVFADEDVCTATDVARVAAVVDGVNLKLRKCGGIRETVKAVAVARALGLRTMIGCDLDTSVAMSAGGHLASLFDHHDLDGPFALAHDPYKGVSYDNGLMTVPDGPGLGIEVPT